MGNLNSKVIVNKIDYVAIFVTHSWLNIKMIISYNLRTLIACIETPESTTLSLCSTTMYTKFAWWGLWWEIISDEDGLGENPSLSVSLPAVD